MDRCKFCGEELAENAKFCTNCGKARAASKPVTGEPVAQAASSMEAVYAEAEYVIEEPEDASAQASQTVDHVIVDKTRPQQPQQPPRQSNPPAGGYTAPITGGYTPTPPIRPSGEESRQPAPAAKQKPSLSRILMYILCGLILLGVIGKIFIMPRFMADQEAEKAAAPTVTAHSKAVETKKATFAPSTPTAAPAYVVSDSRVISIVYGNGMLAGLREDGTVSAIGFKKDANNMDVSDWANIVAIDAPLLGDYLLGLRGDGTLAATGDIRTEALDELLRWKGIVSIYADSQYALGVRQDGTVTAVKVNRPEQSFEHLVQDVSQWTDIRTVKMIGSYAYGRKADGSWVCSSQRPEQYWLKRYPSTAEFFGNEIPLGAALSDSGTVEAPLFTYGDYSIDGWRSIQKLVVLYHYAVGLKKDGTIVLTGDDHFDTYYKEELQPVLSLRDVVDIASEGGTLVALKKDGSVEVAGRGAGFQFDAEKWTQVSSKTQAESRAAQAAGPRLSFLPATNAGKKDNSAEKRQAIQQLQTWEGTPATQWTDYSSYSRREYIVSLGVKGFTDDDAVWYALENSGLDWNAHALRFAQKQLDDPNTNYSFRKLIIRMINDLFTEEEIEYAARRIRVDFQQNAIDCGAHYMKTVTNDPWTQERMVKQLEYEGFTHQEALNAAIQLGLK